MTVENNDESEAVKLAAALIEEARKITFNIPLGDVYYLMNVLNIAVGKNNEDNLAANIMGRLGLVVPKDLFENGREAYRGDLSSEIPLSLSFKEIDFIGHSVLSLPGGREIVGGLPIDPNDRAELDGFRNAYLRSFLILESTFVNAGGRNNEIISRRAKEALS